MLRHPQLSQPFATSPQGLAPPLRHKGLPHQGCGCFTSSVWRRILAPPRSQRRDSAPARGCPRPSALQSLMVFAGPHRRH
eukprot:7096524-Prorocentrum_lima.AAC.1